MTKQIANVATTKNHTRTNLMRPARSLEVNLRFPFVAFHLENPSDEISPDLVERIRSRSRLSRRRRPLLPMRNARRSKIAAATQGKTVIAAWMIKVTSVGDTCAGKSLKSIARRTLSSTTTFQKICTHCMSLSAPSTSIGETKETTVCSLRAVRTNLFNHPWKEFEMRTASLLI
eukprot:scaffold57294_cov32-Tisochrysis_lutea.AAC.5